MPPSHFLTTEEQNVVWRTAWRIVGQDADARDVCQDVMCELMATARLEGATSRTAVLRWLTARRALDRIRRRGQGAESFSEPNASEAPSSETTPAAAAELAELTDRLRAELARLPEAQATAFWLAGVEECPHAEVAEVLATTAAAVAQLVRRARLTLRERLTAFDPNRRS
jgi:RNA polymerase sigma-70 factor, ECF subfamily